MAGEVGGPVAFDLPTAAEWLAAATVQSKGAEFAWGGASDRDYKCDWDDKAAPFYKQLKTVDSDPNAAPFHYMSGNASEIVKGGLTRGGSLAKAKESMDNLKVGKGPSGADKFTGVRLMLRPKR